MSQFYSMRCPSCGRFSSTQVGSLRTHTLRCRYCRVSTKVKREDTIGLSIECKGPYTGREVTVITARMNERDHTTRLTL